MDESGLRAVLRVFVGLIKIPEAIILGVAITLYAVVGLMTAFLVYKTVWVGLHVREYINGSINIILGFLTGPGYNLTAQILLLRIVSFDGSNSILPIGASFALYGFSFSVLLVNLIGSGKPPRGDIIGTGVTAVFPPIFDVAATALAVFSKVNRIDAVVPPVVILFINLFWMCYIIMARPSTLRGVNLFFAAARALSMWGALATIVDNYLPGSRTPLLVLVCGWSFIPLAFIIVWRLPRAFPLKTTLEDSLVPMKELELISQAVVDRRDPFERGCNILLEGSDNHDAQGGSFGFSILRVRREALQRAAVSFRRAIDDNPENIKALDALAMVLIQLGQYHDALEVISRAIDIKYNYERDLIMARAFIGMGRFRDVALASVRIMGDPALRPRCEALRAVTAAHDGRFEEAWGRINACGLSPYLVQLEIDTIRRLEKLATGSSKESDAELEADLVTCQRASDLSPRDPQLLDRLCRAFFKLRRYEEALSAITRSIDIEKGHMRDHALSRVLVKLGRLEEASTAAARAAGNKSVKPYATATRALIAAHRGRFEEAWGLLEEAERFPGCTLETFEAEADTVFELQNEAMNKKAIGLEVQHGQEVLCL